MPIQPTKSDIKQQSKWSAGGRKKHHQPGYVILIITIVIQNSVAKATSITVSILTIITIAFVIRVVVKL